MRNPRRGHRCQRKQRRCAQRRPSLRRYTVSQAQPARVRRPGRRGPSAALQFRVGVGWGTRVEWCCAVLARQHCSTTVLAMNQIRTSFVQRSSIIGTASFSRCAFVCCVVGAQRRLRSAFSSAARSCIGASLWSVSVPRMLVNLQEEGLTLEEPSHLHVGCWPFQSSS